MARYSTKSPSMNVGKTYLSKMKASPLKMPKTKVPKMSIPKFKVAKVGKGGKMAKVKI